MARYFRIIGTLELLGALGIIIWRIIELFVAIDAASKPYSSGGSTLVFVAILWLALAVLIADRKSTRLNSSHII